MGCLFLGSVIANGDGGSLSHQMNIDCRQTRQQQVARLAKGFGFSLKEQDIIQTALLKSLDCSVLLCGSDPLHRFTSSFASTDRSAYAYLCRGRGTQSGCAQP